MATISVPYTVSPVATGHWPTATAVRRGRGGGLGTACCSASADRGAAGQFCQLGSTCGASGDG
jgi:hypothetical protein